MRDLRDPEAVGRKYLRLRAGGMEIADACHVPAEDFKHSASTVDETVAEYRTSMIAAAAQGDASAREVCARNAWAYVVLPDVSRDVDAPAVSHVRHQANGQDIENLEAKKCRKLFPHEPHAWSEVPMPGTRQSVVLYACPGREIEYVV